jgi:phosphoribosylglycinamide formyltransferase-1
MTLGILISGRGSNLQAIIDAIAAGRLAARIAVVISNKPDAFGLERSARAGIQTLVMPHKGYADRADYDRALAEALKARGVELVCLAGFMRLLGPAFLDQFPNAVLNVAQEAIPVLGDDTAETLAMRILEVEHRLYPAAIAVLAGGGWRIEGRRVVAAPRRAGAH